MVIENGMHRPLRAQEKERLMGFHTGHTSHMLSKHELEFVEHAEDIRCNGLGNSFHCIIIARIFTALFKDVPFISVDDIWSAWSSRKNVLSRSVDMMQR
eukprot:7501768-Karenia_brevis.AAC.1